MEAGQVYVMNCQEFWNTMPELEPTGEALRLDHARQCSACAALLEEQRRLADGLRALRQEWRREEAPARLQSRLTSAVRSHNGLTARPRSRRWAPLVTWAAATAAIILLAMFLLRGRQPQPAQHRVPSRLQYAALQIPDANTGFVPLPDAPEIDPNEDVNLVLMELPRARMAALGFSVSEERTSDFVEAEVLLGADGLARAVRFLDD